MASVFRNLVKKQSAFTLIELLVVISVIALLASIALIWMSGVRAQSRDTERVATTDALRKALEMYYDDKGYYPTATNWVKIEEDAGIADALKPYLTRIPSDPSYPKVDGEKVYSYQYQSTLDNQGYKIHVEMETSKFTTYQYEVSSGGGSSIVYGGGGGGGPSNAPTSLLVGGNTTQYGMGVENPTGFIYSTPFFSAVNNHDADATTVQIQLTDASYATPIWNSGDITVASFATGTRSQDIFYGTYGSGGSPPTGILEVGKTYYWRVRTKTASGYSNWSADGTIGEAQAPLIARFYAGTGDGYVYKGAASWSGAHDAAIGEGIDYWSIPLDEMAVASVKLGVAPNIYRGYFPFDTTFLPDAAVVVNAYLYAKVTYTDDTDNDGKDFLVVTQGFQASPNTLTVNDYDDNGSDNGSAGRAMFTPVQEGSDRKDVTNMFVYNYNWWTLNATGTNWISKNGWTKLGLREGHDVLNTAIANGIEVDMKNAGASFGDRPYLEIKYNAAGPEGYALQFDGANDYINVADSNNLRITDALSMEFWIKPFYIASNTYSSVLMKQNTNNSGYAAQAETQIIDPTRVYIPFFLGFGTSSASLTCSVSPNQWSHIVLSWDRNATGSKGCFINGWGSSNPSGSINPIPTSTAPLYIGGNPSSVGYQGEFSGVLDNVRIYNRAIPLAEAAQHYNGIFSNNIGLVGLWKFDEGSGTSTADNSGNGNNGVLVNGVQWVVPQ